MASTRINKFIASATGISRRKADELIASGTIKINGTTASSGSQVSPGDIVTDNGRILSIPTITTIIVHKPINYVCSRDGQGSKTVYDLLPSELHHLKPVGRLDKESSGLLVMTNDGELAHRLTHPSFQKTKQYEVRLDKELTPKDFDTITKNGVMLEDGLSTFRLDYMNDHNFEWKVTMHEGRNRQIRRTFMALGYAVTRLHRTNFGTYSLGNLAEGAFATVQ